MATKRARQLEKLASNIPGANQQVAQGLQSARQIQLQNQIRQLGQPGGQPIGQPQVAQTMGAQQAGQAGQINLQAAQQAQTQQTQVGQLGLQQQARQQRQTAAEQAITLSERENMFANKLNKLSSDVKNELLDKQLQFNRDEAGRALFNTRQRADWLAANAKSKEELQNYMQIERQISNKKIIQLEAAHNKIIQTLKQGYIGEKQQLDNASRKRLIQAKTDIEKKIAEEQAAKANKDSIISGVFTVGGAIAGGVLGAMAGGIGAAPGAAAGAAAGGGIGSAISGAFPKI